MRAITLLLALAICLFATRGAQGQALDDKDIAKLVDEYVSEKTSDHRRAGIEDKLARVKPSQTTRPIKSALGSEKKRAHALALAVKLWTPGVISGVKRQTEGDLCPQIVKLALLRQDKETLEHLIERLKQAPVDSPEFQSIYGGFKAHYAELPILEKLRAVMEKAEDEARKNAVGETLAFQLGVEWGTPQDILDGWNTAKSAREKNGKRFPMEGRDLMAYPTKWSNKGAVVCGGNVVFCCTDGAKISHESDDPESLPKELGSGTWRFLVRVFPKEAPCNFKFGLTYRDKGNSVLMSCKIDGREWSMDITGVTPAKFPVKFNTWATLEFVIYGAAAKATTRSAKASIDGQKIIEGAVFGSEIYSVIGSCEQGEVIVSGVEVLPG